MQLSIGTTISSWTVKGFGSWGKNNTVKYTLMEHKCGNTRKFQQWEIDNNKFKKCKKCEARVEYRKNAEHIIYKTMYRQYKHSAKQRSHSFELEYDDFIIFINSKPYITKSFIFWQCPDNLILLGKFSNQEVAFNSVY